MEVLKYVIEDDKIAELLGVQNFTNKESAVLELVKNAYDGGATSLNIFFHNDSIIFQDDGIGMNYDIVKERWTKVGSSKKEYEFLDNNNNRRIYSGSKGIGRFALARLGKEVEVLSKMKDSNGVRWFTDWSKTYLEEIKVDNIGTIIRITSLRDSWTKKAVEIMKSYLSIVYNDDSMKIELFYDDKLIGIVTRPFINPKLGINCLSIINIIYNSKNKQLKCEIKQDEFLDEANKYCTNIDIKEKHSLIDISNEVFEDLDIEKDKQQTLLEQLGSFSAEFYFSFKPIKDDCERFLYKHQALLDQYSSGIILYRNAFSISSYEGKKDWLGLGKRARKSPAAATHPTGSWRVRDNQISGKVLIDKKENNKLQDLSNRQGLNENEYYKIFIQILSIGLSEFERYRQSIIRCINSKNQPIEKSSYMIDSFLSKPLKVREYKDDEVKSLASEVSGLVKNQKELIRNNVEAEQRYRYDTRILNSLSTVGLKAASIAHELQNDRDNIAYCSEMLIPRLKELGVWEVLNKSDNRDNVCDDVPQMLQNNEKIINKTISFMDVMLTNIEKRNFEPRELIIYDELLKTKESWEYDYKWVSININIKQDVSFVTSVDIINVIFDNLILNSIQQNDSKKELVITISCSKYDSNLSFEYNDNGVGLNEKYLANPDIILEVHESSRKNGHGLGMWIINNTLKMTGGEVDNIDGHNGFSIQFTMGGNL